MDNIENEEKIAGGIIEQVNIDEEMKRLISNFAQARKILASDGSIGKKMDFLIQEINREINTTGSKANDIEITNRVLKMKNLVEEMREQVQNLV